MNEFYYFSTSIYRKEVERLIDRTLICADTYIDRQRALNEQDSLSVDVVQTVSLEHDPAIFDVASYFTETSVEILERQGYNTSLYNFYPTLWAQSVVSPGYHDIHTHPQSCMAALYYLQIPENGSVPVFEDPRIGKNVSMLEPTPSENITDSTSLIHFANVIPGTMLFFNSWLPHSLSQSRTDIPTKFIHMCLLHERKR